MSLYDWVLLAVVLFKLLLLVPLGIDIWRTSRETKALEASLNKCKQKGMRR